MREPNALISTEALARDLGDSNLRIFDCTTYLEPPPPGSDVPYIAVPGRNELRGGAHPRRRFPRSPRRVLRQHHAASLHDAAGGAARGRLWATRHRPGARVVLYSIGTMMWATRFWWMLKALGFDGAAVLDGGFDKWQAEGRPVES